MALQSVIGWFTGTKLAMSLQNRVLRTLQTHNLLPAGEVVVVGVSGGADSLALLHSLHQLRERVGYRLHVATLDHGLRGEAGAADVDFVVSICNEWGIPVTSGVQGIDSKNIGIEESARVARYQFLAKVAGEVGAQRVAVAHQAGDQAETVLMHILRGAGLYGLGGMRYSAPMPHSHGYTLVRPLLNISRREIEAYCKEHDLSPRHDLTNEDIKFLRNRLRHDVLPMIDSIIPNVEARLNQLTDVAQVENDFMEQAVQKCIAEHVTVADAKSKSELPVKQVFIPRPVFADLHPALQRRLIAWAIKQVWRAQSEIGYKHILAAVGVALNSEVGAIAQMPAGLQLRVDYDHLIIEWEVSRTLEPDMPLLTRNNEIPVTVPGATLVNDDWLLLAATEPLEDAAARLVIPPNAVVKLRVRQAGDRFAPLGMNGHTRKISRWMVDHKIPQALRDQIPLLVVNENIAAIALGDSWAINEKFAPHTNSPSVIAFKWAKKG
jgi:tRNA(Ile)-lysidine synthase